MRAFNRDMKLLYNYICIKVFIINYRCLFVFRTSFKSYLFSCAYVSFKLFVLLAGDLGGVIRPCALYEG